MEYLSRRHYCPNMRDKTGGRKAVSRSAKVGQTSSVGQLGEGIGRARGPVKYRKYKQIEIREHPKQTGQGSGTKDERCLKDRKSRGCGCKREEC